MTLLTISILGCQEHSDYVRVAEENWITKTGDTPVVRYPKALDCWDEVLHGASSSDYHLLITPKVEVDSVRIRQFLSGLPPESNPVIIGNHSEHRCLDKQRMTMLRFISGKAGLLLNREATRQLSGCSSIEDDWRGYCQENNLEVMSHRLDICLGFYLRNSGVILQELPLFSQEGLPGSPIMSGWLTRFCKEPTDMVRGASSSHHHLNEVSGHFEKLKNEKSDINEHLPIIAQYASQSKSILLAGVGRGEAVWAALKGLLEGGGKRLLVSDQRPPPLWRRVEEIAKANTIQLDFHSGNSLTIPLGGEIFDLVLIDTWHVYGQMKRELALFTPHCNGVMMMHDTTVDEFVGETIRQKGNPFVESKRSGFPVTEICTGIWPAIQEFLDTNPNYGLVKRLTNCNGLTILKIK